MWSGIRSSCSCVLSSLPFPSPQSGAAADCLWNASFKCQVAVDVLGPDPKAWSYKD